MSLKLTFLILFIACLSACNQKTKATTMENNKTVDAIIIGFDARRCLHCGGYMVTFSNNPEPYKADHYQWRPKTEKFGVNHSSKFPLYVKIKYKNVKSDQVASKGEIEITEMEFKQK